MGWSSSSKSSRFCTSECELLHTGVQVTAHRSVSYCTLECELLHTGVLVSVPELIPEEIGTFLRENIVNGCIRRQKSTFTVIIAEH